MDSAAASGKALLIVITGPTAVGKTAASIALARALDGEVVNADSRYFYRGMDIGTAKPDLAERQGVPHHLIDLLDPAESMSLARYQDLANAAIRDIHARGRLPFLVGGTPQYINAVVEGWRIPRVAPDPVLRHRLEREVAANGVAPLLERLRAVDPVAAERIGRNARRIIRALEVHEATGEPISAQQGKGPAPFETREYWLSLPRERLYAAIDNRVDDQIARGLIAEIRHLVCELGVPPDAPAMSSLGYRQALPAVLGGASIAEVTERIKFETHRYVRHQETWLRKNPRLIRIDLTVEGWLDRLRDEIARDQMHESAHNPLPRPYTAMEREASA
jgi:tRNA dimethylallyltransferase